NKFHSVWKREKSRCVAVCFVTKSKLIILIVTPCVALSLVSECNCMVTTTDNSNKVHSLWKREKSRCVAVCCVTKSKLFMLIVTPCVALSLVSECNCVQITTSNSNKVHSVWKREKSRCVAVYCVTKSKCTRG